jgi:uncharacterized membrane protein
MPAKLESGPTRNRVPVGLQGVAACPATGAALSRIPELDILRGLAIALMVPANAGADLLHAPHPFGLRLLNSLAAPIFVVLSGMMLGRADRSPPASASRRQGFRRALGRGAFLVLIGMLIDSAIGGYLPLMTCDVLYAIGLALPACWLAARFPWPARLGFAGMVFALTPIVQDALGYRLVLDTPPVGTPPERWPELAAGAARRFVVDGWFPLFPWLGFALLGTALGGLRDPGRSLPRMGLGATLIGAAMWAAEPGPLAVRCGYSELFYPPVPGFIVTAAGAVLTLLGLARALDRTAAGGRLATMGRCSLLLYIAHLLVIRRLADWIDEPFPLAPFLLLCGTVMGGLLLVAQGVDRLKRRYREQGRRLPGVAAVLLGT